MKSLEQYTGLNIADRLEGMARECYLCCWEWMKNAWGNNVEFQRMENQVLFCPETRDYLYGQKPDAVKYIVGSRPFLEKIVDGACEGCSTDREKVLAILVYIRDLHKKVSGADFFYGGTEEELIKKSEWFCERVSRLMVGLCEIIGLPGRIIFHVASGHLTCEIFFEGKWAYIDPRCGMFCLDENEKFMSVEEIINNREIIFRQSDFVNSFHSPHWSLDFRQHRNYHFCFNPREIQCFGEYSLMDAEKYNFDWMPSCEKGIPPELQKVHKRYDETGMMLLVQ